MTADHRPRHFSMAGDHRNCILIFLSLLFYSSLSLNQEGLLLLQFKSGLHDPRGALSDWTLESLTPCSWRGISCTDRGAVSAVHLDSLDLEGPFSSSLCRLPFLSNISLSTNFINSTLEEESLSPCSSLSLLDLSMNNLVGPLPSTLSSLPNLRTLNLDSNNFSGEIPPSFANFPLLESLSIVYNLLSGTIPPFLGNISTLRVLNLAYNPFSPGVLPPELGNLKELRELWLSECSLMGGIPSSLGSLSFLENLDLSQNSLNGTIPETLSRLTNLYQLELFKNSLSGHIPSELGLLPKLQSFDASLNNLEGSIPDTFFKLPLLQSFHLYQNQLSGGLPQSMAKASSLSDLRLHGNRLNGTLPSDMGLDSPLVVVEVSQNEFSGEIPRSICHGRLLEQLMLIGNLFSGKLPEDLSYCVSLRRVRLSNNLLSGIVPAAMWGLPNVNLLDLAGNLFSGEISPSISGARDLSSLLISKNQFSGQLPFELCYLPKLIRLSANDNMLTGVLPPEIGKLAELQILNLNNNSISGELPRDILSWKSLTEFNLGSNRLGGSIPPELGSLPVLNYLDLSSNFLSGSIPPELQKLKLNSLNLSYNRLSGDIPPLFTSEAYKDSFSGNPGLYPSSSSPEKRLYILCGILSLTALVLLIGLSMFYIKYRRFLRLNWRRGRNSNWKLTSFHKVSFPEREILEALEEKNLIGAGSSGEVFHVVLGDGSAVAVKKLRSLPLEKKDAAFEAEIATLGSVRHKNIVRLWCCCVLKDCNLLVYEYLPNGSLSDVLYKEKAKTLEWAARKNIAIDVAEGLSYLHHDCVPPVIHRDVKSSNILLDGDFRAKIGDFGVAKVSDPAKSMTAIAGSLGYIAPEYAYTMKVSEKSDVYSFGVVLLELVTGRHPLEGELGGMDLVKWACSVVEEKGTGAVMDSSFGDEYKEERERVLRLALLCTNSLPLNRPTMGDVVKVLLGGGFPEAEV